MSNVDAVKGIYDAFAKGDVPGVLGVLDANVEWGEAEGFIFDIGKKFIGPDEVLQGVFMRIANETTDFTVHPKTYVDGGDAVVAMGRYTGSLNATGKQYTDTGQFQKAAAG